MRHRRINTRTNYRIIYYRTLLNRSHVYFVVFVLLLSTPGYACRYVIYMHARTLTRSLLIGLFFILVFMATSMPLLGKSERVWCASVSFILRCTLLHWFWLCKTGCIKSNNPLAQRIACTMHITSNVFFFLSFLHFIQFYCPCEMRFFLFEKKRRLCLTLLAF